MKFLSANIATHNAPSALVVLYTLHNVSWRHNPPVASPPPYSGRLRERTPPQCSGCACSQAPRLRRPSRPWDGQRRWCAGSAALKPPAPPTHAAECVLCRGTATDIWRYLTGKDPECMGCHPFAGNRKKSSFSINYNKDLIRILRQIPMSQSLNVLGKKNLVLMFWFTCKPKIQKEITTINNTVFLKTRTNCPYTALERKEERKGYE